MIHLFVTFFKIGLFTFGGGYAMIPMIQQNVLKNGWLSQNQLIDFIAISESTPGPFAINIATFVGISQHGLLGGICATLGVVLPSFLIILIIARFFLHFQDNVWVKSVLYGLRPAVVALIGAAALSILQANFVHGGTFSIRSLLIVFIVFGISRWKKKLHPIWLILVSGALGFLFHAFLPILP